MALRAYQEPLEMLPLVCRRRVLGRGAAPSVIYGRRSKLKRAVLVAVLLALLVAPDSASSQDKPFLLDTIVVVGTRLSPGLASRTRGVEVLGRERLDALPVRTITEALQWVLGVDVMARSPAQADLAIRGCSFEQALVLVDGVPMSDPQTGHFDLNLVVPLSQVVRIEVLRGPASALYGTDAMGGVVNIVTRAPVPLLEARIQGGSFGTVAGSLGAGTRLGGARIAAAADFVRSDGHRAGTDYWRGQFYLSAAAGVWGGDLKARAGHELKNFGAADFYASFPSYEETRTTTAAAAWVRSLSAQVELEPRLYIRRNRDYFVLDREDPEFYSNRHVSSQLGAEAVVRYRSGGAMSLAAGAAVGRDILESSNLGDRAEDRWALFAEAVGLWGPFTLSAGARGDHHESYGSLVSPSLSAAFLYKSLRLRGSYGRSFRAPTWTERYYQDPVNRGRSDLKPETGWTAELGADVSVSDGLWLSVAAFRRRATDLIDWARPAVADEGVWQTRNVQSATFQGLEGELSGIRVLGTRVGVRGSTLSVSAEDADGFVSKYALRPLVRDLSLSVAHDVGPLSAEARMKYRRRRDETGHWLLDLRVVMAVYHGEVHVDLLNGLNEEYSDITGARAAGRSITVGFRMRRRW